jgi:hypothetical protein
MPLCMCKTATGKRCSKSAVAGSKYCGTHMKKCSSQVQQVIPQTLLAVQALQQQRKVQPLRLKLPTQQRKVQPLRLKLPKVQQRKVQPLRLRLPTQQRKVQPLRLKLQKPKAQPRGCVRQTLKKYTTRPSPAFPANECCGQEMMGNDGNVWKSMPNAKGICSWKVILIPK